MSAGRLVDARAAADEILRRRPWDHGAIVLKISAAARTDALAGLDVYEAWLESGPSEDLSLLEPIAHATATAFASSDDRGLRIAALEQLARHGELRARRQLTALATTPPGIAGADAALARIGDAAAAARLRTMAASAGQHDPTVMAEVLADAGSGSVPALLALLEKGRGPSRAAAATALGKLRATTALEPLRRALADPEPLLSSSAAVALARLGDAEARARIDKMITSELPDLRLLAAEAWDGQPGPWVDAIRPLLADSTGLVRLHAARLIAPVEFDAAASTLQRATRDQNPVVRVTAASIAKELATQRLLVLDLPTVRRLLRDGEAAIRLAAASTVLERVRAQR